MNEKRESARDSRPTASEVKLPVVVAIKISTTPIPSKVQIDNQPPSVILQRLNIYSKVDTFK